MTINQILSASRKATLLLALCTALNLSFSACKKEDNPVTGPLTINEQINSNDNFTLLRAALAKAGLNTTLGAAGTYTLFAPTNAAFQAFGLTSEAIINLAPVSTIQAVLQYHVVGSKITTFASATNTAQQTLLPNTSLYITRPVAVTTSGTSTTAVAVNGARIAGASSEASNGIIYPIDRILLPPVYGNIPSTLTSIPTIYALIAPTAGISFRLLTQAATRAGVGSALTAAGPLTVFAPTDNAFRAAGLDSVAIANTPVATLTNVLSYHVLNNSRIYTPMITNGTSLTTLQGGTITANISTTAVTVTGTGSTSAVATIIGPDVTATNGIIHIIDRVLRP